MDAVAWKGSGILWVTKPTCADVPFPWRRPSQKEIVRKGFFLSCLDLNWSVLFCFVVVAIRKYLVLVT